MIITTTDVIRQHKRIKELFDLYPDLPLINFNIEDYCLLNGTSVYTGMYCMHIIKIVRKVAQLKQDEISKLIRSGVYELLKD